jgi:hypothetical protein
MTTYFKPIGLDQPAQYRIEIQGRLDVDLSDWFKGEARCAAGTGRPGVPVTCLTGTVADQSALHGLLNHVRDLGLVLLRVECLSARMDISDHSNTVEGT